MGMKPLAKQLAAAIQLASTFHEGQYDKAGQPYILHVLWVMHKIRHLGHKFMIAAVLHDIVEDTEITTDMLLKMNYNTEVVHAIKLLTKDEDAPTDYQEYIERIAENNIAREVKLRDLEHNSKITRLKGIRPADIKRMEKYHRAYLYLKNYTP